MSCSKSCTRCHALKKKCVRASADASCAHCQKHGLECVPHVRAAWGSKKRKRGRPKKKRAHRTGKMTKTNTQGAQPKGGGATDDSSPPDTQGNWFVSRATDMYAFTTYRHLSPDHWGLQVMIRTLTVIVANRACWWLCAAVSWLATTTGFANETNFFAPCSVPVDRTYKVGDFGDVATFVMRYHDEKTGATGAGAWVPWSEHTLGDRVLGVSTKEHISGEAVVVSSPRYHQTFVTELKLKKLKDHRSLPFQDFGAFMYSVEDCTRCTHAMVDIIKEYETLTSGPITRCVSKVTLHDPKNGPIKGNAYVTVWCGADGLDGVGIHEFVPGEASTQSSVKVIEDIGENDRSAAEGMLKLLKKNR